MKVQLIKLYDAQDWINERDVASEDYLRRFYKEDLEDPLLYHLVINTGKVSLKQAAHTIADLVREAETVTFG